MLIRFCIYCNLTPLCGWSGSASGVGACGSALSIVFLYDDRWCTRHEVDEARRYAIPIIVLVDTDKQLAREVIDKYMELGFSWLFDEQAR